MTTRRERIDQFAERFRVSHNEAKHLVAMLDRDPDAKAMPMKHLVIHPSSVAEWLWGCQRRWMYDATRPREPDDDNSQSARAFGTRAHLALHKWLADFRPPDPSTKEGRAAIAALAYSPAPGSVDSEVTRSPVIADVQWSMTPDWSGYLPATRTAILGDLKTIGHWGRKKSAEDLACDPQLLCYAYLLLIEYPTAECIECTWVYVHRTELTAQPVTFTLSRAEVAEKFDQIVTFAVDPIREAWGTPPEQIPRNLRAQWCPHCKYQDECLADVTPHELYMARLERTDMTESSKLMAELAAAAQSLTTTERFAPQVQQWIDAHPPDMRAAAIAQAKAGGHKPLAPEPPLPPLPSHPTDGPLPPPDVPELEPPAEIKLPPKKKKAGRPPKDAAAPTSAAAQAVAGSSFERDVLVAIITSGMTDPSELREALAEIMEEFKDLR